jgi:integrase
VAAAHTGSVSNKGKDGRWRGRVMIGRVVYTVSSTVSKADARRLLRIKIGQVLAGEAEPPAARARRPSPATAPAPAPAAAETVAAYLEGWLEHKRRSLRSSAGHASYRWAVRRHIVPHIGAVPLADLRPRHVQAMIAAVADTAAARSVALAHAVLRAALNDGLREERADIAPGCARVRAPAVARTEIRYPSAGELDAIHDAARADPAVGHLIALACHTGLRLGELCGLAWRHVHNGPAFPDAYLDVTQQVAHHDGKIRELKSHAARRRIALGPAALAALAARLEQQHIDAAVAGDAFVNEHGLVFTDRRGGALHHEEVRVAFKAALERSGVGDLYRFHDLRHGHAMRLLRAGASLETIRQRLGHASIATTSAHYFHRDPTLDADAARRAEGLRDT